MPALPHLGKGDAQVQRSMSFSSQALSVLPMIQNYPEQIE